MNLSPAFEILAKDLPAAMYYEPQGALPNSVEEFAENIEDEFGDTVGLPAVIEIRLLNHASTFSVSGTPREALDAAREHDYEAFA